MDGRTKLRDGRENTIPKRDGKDTIIHGKLDIAPSYAGLWSKNDGGQHNMENSTRDVLEEEVHKLKPYYNNAMPPPYTKTNAKPKDTRHGASVGSSQIGSDINAVPKDPPMDNIANSWNSSVKIQQGAYHLDHEMQNVGLTRENGHGHEKCNYYQDDDISNPIPKPRSMRRRYSKSHSSHDDAGNSEDTGGVKRRSRSRRSGDDSRKGLQLLFEDDHYQKDEDERMIDKLLIHYSKKPSAYEPGKVRRKSKSRHAHQQGTEADKSPWHINRDGPDEISEMVSEPPRSISLPREQTNSSEARKVFTRAASFQPDKSSLACHVLPK